MFHRFGKGTAGYTRGQVNYLDFMAAIVIFVILLVMLVTVWQSNIFSMNSEIKKNALQYAAVSASDLMMKSPGVPSNWEQNSSAAQAVGFASSQNVLSDSKLSAFTAMDYSSAKRLLGVASDFYFTVEDASGNKLYRSGNATLGELSVSVVRFAVLNNQKVRVRLTFHG